MNAPSFAPRWLRPAAISGALALHALVAWRFAVAPATLISPQDAIEVAIVAAGDASEDRPPTTESSPDSRPAPAAAPTPAVSAAAEPEPTPPSPTPEAAIAERPPPAPSPAPSVAASLEPPTKLAPPPAARPRPKPRAELRPPAKPRPAAHSPTKEASRRAASAAGAGDSAPSAAAKRGAANGSPESNEMSRASYAALLSAEIGRHKVYPAAARQRGATGAVGVRLTVGPSGRIVSHAVTRSSGDADLDAAVGAMMAAVAAPPPPGGRFVGDIVIRFDLQ